MNETTITLTAQEWTALSEANRLLWELTDSHHHACTCELCRARMLTTTTNGLFRTFRCVLAADNE